MAPAQPDGPPLTHKLTVPATEAGARLDQVLAQLLSQHSRSRLQAWIEAGQVEVDGGVVAVPRHRLRGGEALLVTEAIAAPLGEAAAQPIPLSIVHEDETLLVIDKPAGLVVHPGSGNRDGTLLNALLHHEPLLAALPRAGIVHRLDKDTSGLMVVAKTQEAQTDLVRQLAARTVRREYVALVHGDLAKATTIDAPIGRHPRERTSMAVVATGKPARTHVEVIERYGVATLLHCRLETGRTHQIRVHLTAIGHPLVGDPTYRGRRGVTLPPPPKTPAASSPEGGARLGAAMRREVALPPELRSFARQALHAQRLGLVHPQSRSTMQWEAPLPEDMALLLDALRILRTDGKSR